MTSPTAGTFGPEHPRIALTQDHAARQIFEHVHDVVTALHAAGLHDPARAVSGLLNEARRLAGRVSELELGRATVNRRNVENCEACSNADGFCLWHEGFNTGYDYFARAITTLANSGEEVVDELNHIADQWQANSSGEAA